MFSAPAHRLQGAAAQPKTSTEVPHHVHAGARRGCVERRTRVQEEGSRSPSTRGSGERRDGCGQRKLFQKHFKNAHCVTREGQIAGAGGGVRRR